MIDLGTVGFVGAIIGFLLGIHASNIWWLRDANELNEKLQQGLWDATKLAREIHQKLKRGERTGDHGLIGNLGCILDHVCRKDDPPPL